MKEFDEVFALCGTLPLPGAIIGMFEDDVADRRLVDNSANYDGRKRTFAHEEGNWATFVYIKVTDGSTTQQRLVFIPYEHESTVVPIIDDHFGDQPEVVTQDKWSLMTVPYRETLGKFMEKVVEILEPLEFHLLDDFHISLSRTVVIRHHWIASLIDSLKENINKCPRSCIALEGFKVFKNDEKTRTFLALECLCSESLLEYVEKIDRSFAEFNLQKYYENPSFHVSVCWSLENKKEIISAKKMAVLQEQLFEFLDENPDLKYFEVDELLCKTGNKIFCLPLCDQ